VAAIVPIIETGITIIMMTMTMTANKEIRLFDTHCHLASENFNDDLGQILKNAELAGVAHITTVATEPTNAKKCAEIALQHSSETLKIYPTMGIHPHEAKIFDASNALLIENAFQKNSPYVAVGETGLDYHYDFSPQDIQKESFDFHIELAIRVNKPLIIHCRECVDDIYAMLAAKKGHYGSTPGIMHCYVENWEWAQKFLDLGFYLSFSGVLTFKSAESIREVAQKAPLDKILIETDSPYLAPNPYRGKRNEPSYVKNTFEVLRQCRANMDAFELSEQLEKNSKAVFQLT